MQIRKKVDWNINFRVAKPQNPDMMKNPEFQVVEPQIPAISNQVHFI